MERVRQHDAEPNTGGVYATFPEGLWYRTETPRLQGPLFSPPDPHIMRDPTLATTWPATGGSPVEVSGFRSLVRPWQAPRPGG